MNVIIVGGGTSGLISALMLKHTYPDINVKIIKSTKVYENTELSKVAHEAIGYGITPRQLNNPKNKDLRDKIISYIEQQK